MIYTIDGVYPDGTYHEIAVDLDAGAHTLPFETIFTIRWTPAEGERPGVLVTPIGEGSP